MTISRKEVASLFAALACTVQGMSDQQFVMWLAGEGSLRFDSVTRSKSKNRKETLPPADLEELRANLQTAVTREDAWDIMARAPRVGRRVYLAQFAKMFRVHITKQDTVPKIEEKLIEAIVGPKIRSKAIQDLPL